RRSACSSRLPYTTLFRSQGPGVLVNLGKLILSLYLALIIFVVLVFGIVAFIVRLPIRQFFRAVREPAALAFATTSSESALPKAIDRKSTRLNSSHGSISH